MARPSTAASSAYLAAVVGTALVRPTPTTVPITCDRPASPLIVARCAAGTRSGMIAVIAAW